MKNKFLIQIIGVTSMFLSAGNMYGQSSGFAVAKVFHIASAGGWDYIAVGPGNNRLYVSHSAQVNILDQTTGDSVGVIPNATGVHGIAFVPSLNKGYTSNGRLNNVSVFDLKTNAVLSQIAAGTNPDAIMYDEYSKRIITCNGQSNDLTLIDPVTEKITATIRVGGKPETAVSDGNGKIYVNIEDKNEIIAINLKTASIVKRWSVAPAEGPTGLAIDLKKNRLFAGCDGKLVILDIASGKISTVGIGNGCDGVAFDAALGYTFASCGEGKLSIVKEMSPGVYALVENVKTKSSARTIALDEQTHTVYLPAADMGKAVPGQRAPMIAGSFQILVVKQKNNQEATKSIVK